LTNNPIRDIIKTQKEKTKEIKIMKTYTVTMKTKRNWNIVYNFKAKTAFGAGVKAVLRFYDLGARPASILSVAEA
jgi:hypothetical protein